MKNNIITVVGHFAINKDAADGQTVKTRVTYDALKLHYGTEKITFIDTHNWKKAPLQLLWQSIKASRYSSDIILMPARNGLAVFSPLFILLRKLGSFKLHYIVIGGWLPNYLQSHKLIAYFIIMFDAIYVETSSMLNKLQDRGYNVLLLRNYKPLKPLKSSSLKQEKDSTLKLCTFSRINQKKGIEDAINAVIAANESREIYTLDIFGRVDPDYEKRFKIILSNSPEYIQYKGIIDFNESTHTLKSYHLLLFPTLYKTEGIPGTIIDAYASGLPVIASKWDNFHDIITDNQTGLGYDLGSTSDLVEILKHRININELKRWEGNCLKASEQFTSLSALGNLFKNIGHESE